MKQKLKLALAAFIFLLVATFALQNTAVVTVKLLVWDVSMSQSILVFVLLLIGFVIGRIIGFKKHRKNINRI